MKETLWVAAGVLAAAVIGLAVDAPPGPERRALPPAPVRAGHGRYVAGARKEPGPSGFQVRPQVSTALRKFPAGP